ncbi:MmgE/PrpD family protein [Psychrobacillus sp. FJAT-51614]|uniref:MmgE/PrpD family protein n=1 Tax=Psychrobacillus mangrovi TaxID=3117745 RepID=A0ABU8F446_9BACI
MDLISQSLANFSRRISYSSLHPNVILEVNRRILDTLGCLVAGYDSHASSVARKFSLQYLDSNGATVIGTNHKVISEYATLANGGAIRYLDFNDTYLSLEPLHPSDVIAPLLALSEQYDISIEKLTTSIAISYEIGVLFCDAASLKKNGWDHVNYITLATVVGASHLLDLTEQETVNAIALAIVPHAAMRQTRNGEISEWKGIAAANAAKNAVFAVKLAKSGMSGPFEALQGSMGMNALLLNSKLSIEEVADMINRTDSPNAITRTYIKNWAVEYMTQSAIEATLKIREHVSSLNDIEKIEIETFQLAYDVLAKDTQKWNPKTRETADHSLPYIVVVALEDGKIDLNTFSDERLKNEQTLERIKNIVTVRVTEEMESGYPAGNPNKITIQFKNGSVVSEMVSKPLGHSSNPMKNEQIIEKFNRITQEKLTETQQKRVVDLVFNLQGQSSLQEVFNALLLEQEVTL